VEKRVLARGLWLCYGKHGEQAAGRNGIPDRFHIFTFTNLGAGFTANC
jgi:hypothetical protein